MYPPSPSSASCGRAANSLAAALITPTKATADDDERLLWLYVEPILGGLRLDEITLEDGDHVMESFPEHLAPSSRRHVAQVVRRVLALAVYPARHIQENPIPRGWLPRAKSTKAFSCLWPAEDANLLACQAVPLVRRLFFGVLDREGMRREEAADLRWRDVDLERGRVRLDQNKTDDPRAWDAGVAAALRVWRSHFQADAAEQMHVFREAGRPVYVDQMAQRLRADLRTAGVTRPELFERTAARQPIRVHDLRATFVTVSLANICGPKISGITARSYAPPSSRSALPTGRAKRGSSYWPSVQCDDQRYRRQARTWAELGLGELARFDRALPELAAIAPRLPHETDVRVEPIARNLAESKGFEPLVPLRVHLISKPCTMSGDRAESWKLGSIGDPSGPEIGHFRTAVGQSWGNPGRRDAESDPVQQALASAIQAAAAAGRFDVVTQLAKELEAHRLERVGRLSK